MSQNVSLSVYIVENKYCMVNCIASFAILVYHTHCEQKRQYNWALSFSTKTVILYICH